MGQTFSAYAEGESTKSSCPVNAPQNAKNVSATCPNENKSVDSKQSPSMKRPTASGAHTMQRVSGGGGGCPYSGGSKAKDKDSTAASETASDPALTKKYNVYSQEIDPKNNMPLNPNQVSPSTSGLQ